jgi:hypothetical protein
MFPFVVRESATKEEIQMSQYMLLIYDDESVWRAMSEEERSSIIGEYFAYTEELKQAGVYVAGDALQPVSTAKSLRLREGERLTTDGPFAETKEALGGYYLVDVASDEEALDWAAKIPSARLGTIEVRPLVVFPEHAEAGA